MNDQRGRRAMKKAMTGVIVAVMMVAFALVSLRREPPGDIDGLGRRIVEPGVEQGAGRRLAPGGIEQHRAGIEAAQPGNQIGADG